jgi:hypothetical protein
VKNAITSKLIAENHFKTISITITREKLRISRRNFRRSDLSELRKNRAIHVYVNYSLFAIRINNNESDDKL